MKLNLFNKTRQKISLNKFARIAELFPEVAGEVEVTFVGEKRMRDTNRDYRFKDKPTDVLSFEYAQGDDLLGEILIYPQHSTQTVQELDRLIIHGILHILGYDHEQDELQAQEMETIQEHLLDKFRSKK